MPGGPLRGSSGRRGGAGWRQESAAIAAEAAADEAVAVTVNAAAATEETVADTVEVAATDTVQVVRSDTSAAAAVRRVRLLALRPLHTARRGPAACAALCSLCVRWRTLGVCDATECDNQVAPQQ